MHPHAESSPDPDTCGRDGRWRAGAVGLVVGAMVLLAGCEEAPPPPESPRPVRTLALQATDVDLVGEFPAEIRPRVESSLGFRVGGKIVERRVQAGQQVRRGQVLARIDASDLRLNANAARAQVDAAAIDRAQKAADLKRYEQLRQQGFISAAEFEARRSAAESAEAQFQQARAGLAVQTNQAAYAVLVADADGVVTAVDAEVGQVVAAGQSVVRVANTADKEAAFLIPEHRVEQVRKLANATVTTWNGGPALQGRVREISGSADPATRAFAARVTLIDPPPTLNFGTTATVTFEGRAARPLTPIPLSALLNDGQQTWIWRLDPAAMTVHRAPVRVLTVGDVDALIEDTLPAATEIVTAGVHQLREGQRVKRLAEPARQQPAAPAPVRAVPTSGAVR